MEHRVDLDTLLVRTSRTFAISIPHLPEPTSREVSVAYLLFRIADTFEDATRWNAARQRAALVQFADLLEAPSVNGEAGRLAEGWVREPPLDHAGYVQLLQETPGVLEAYWGLRPAARRIISRHVRRTAQGMADFVARGGDAHDLQLRDLDDLRDYCYVVAGIVGEMLTELFVLERPGLAEVSPYLQERARWFGEGLQLTNILKDRATDVTEGRSYFPPGVERGELLGVARSDLRMAEEYSSALQRAGAPRGVVAFTALPVLLAWATLDRVEAEGPGAKLSRREVGALLHRMEAALDADVPVFAEANA